MIILIHCYFLIQQKKTILFHLIESYYPGKNWNPRKGAINPIFSDMQNSGFKETKI